jgi:hypothetical protein
MDWASVEEVSNNCHDAEQRLVQKRAGRHAQEPPALELLACTTVLTGDLHTKLSGICNNDQARREGVACLGDIFEVGGNVACAAQHDKRRLVRKYILNTPCCWDEVI